MKLPQLLRFKSYDELNNAGYGLVMYSILDNETFFRIGNGAYKISAEDCPPLNKFDVVIDGDNLSIGGIRAIKIDDILKIPGILVLSK